MALSDFFKRNKPTIEAPEEQRSFVNEYYNPIYGSIPLTSTSSYVTSKSLTLSTVFRCINLISESIASMPLIPYTFKGDWKYADEASPLYNLLNVQPNPIMGSFVFKKLIIDCLLRKGNCYIYIDRDKQKNPMNLYILEPTLIRPIIENGNLYYKDDTNSKIYNKEDIIHILNYTQDGLIGESTITHAANTLGIAYNSEQHASNFFLGGAALAGILRPIAGVNISKEKATKAKADFVTAMAPTAYTNPTIITTPNNNSIVVLDSGLEYQPISVSPKDSQLLESRQFNVQDICRFFNVPPSLAFSQGDKFSTSEQQSLDFLNNCLAPLIEKIENEFFRKLYPSSEWINSDLRFDTEQLLRMDAVTRGSYYSQMFNIGALQTNEIRYKINAPNPVKGGNRSFIQVNLQPLDNLISEQPGADPMAPINNQVQGAKNNNDTNG